MKNKEGKFILIRGKQRAGKTLLMSILAKSAYDKQRPIYTNIEYSFDYTPLYFKELDLDDEEITYQIRNATITLDELWMIIDSRSSQNKDQKKFSRFLYQVKKLGVDLIGTTHEVDLLDKRARQNFDYLFDVQVLPKRRPEGVPPTHIYYTIENGPLQEDFFKKKLLTLHPSYFDLYNTENVFDPLIEPPHWDEEERKARKKAKRNNWKETGFMTSKPHAEVRPERLKQFEL